jgi:protein PhnA
MTHYICKGSCRTSSDEMAVCESDECTHQWEILEACECHDNQHGQEEELIVKDANGNRLHDGDSVSLIKDLTLRGTSQVIKIGTKVTKIKLTDNPEEIDCKINGTQIVLRTEFLKKL